MVLLWFLISLPAGAQIGGKRTFSFLALPANAQSAAMGGVQVTAAGPQAASLAGNPALLQPGQHQQASFSFTDYLADVSQQALHYVSARPGKNAWGFGLSYLGYGQFTQTDEAGRETGTFSAADYVLGVTRAYTIAPFTLGLTAKVAVSGIADYKAVALLTDLGGVYRHPEKDLVLGLTLRHIGYQVKTFAGRDREPLPFELQAGGSYKPEHMPFRFFFTAQQGQQFDIVYSDTTGQSAGVQVPRPSLADKLARHLVLGGELLLGKNLDLRLGYNHLRRQELGGREAPGASGLSLGLALRLRGFQLDYAHGFYHRGAGSHFFTLGASLEPLFKKNKQPGS
ncbi:MAG: type IX secretion system protein PorQ [Adhaeribacter sp.]